MTFYNFKILINCGNCNEDAIGDICAFSEQTGKNFVDPVRLFRLVINVDTVII